MTEKEFEGALAKLINTEHDELGEIHSVKTFAEDGVMTNNKGLAVTMANGDEFQITIVKH